MKGHDEGADEEESDEGINWAVTDEGNLFFIDTGTVQVE